MMKRSAKTGSTSDAGHCLISSAARGDLHFVSVILGAERVEENGVGNLRSFSETTRMFNYGFENYTYKTIIESKHPVQEIPVSLSELDHVTIHPAKDIEVLIPVGLEPEHLERTIELQAPVEAPVEKGQKLGSMELSYDGKYSSRESAAEESNLSEEEMLQMAADFLGEDSAALRLEYEYEGEGHKRCFSLGDSFVCVSGKGVDSMGQSRLVGESKLSPEEAQKAAEDFLTSKDYVNLKLVSSRESGNTLLMGFAEACAETATMEKNPKLEGRFMGMFLAPKNSK